MKPININNIKISKFSELKGQLTAKRPNEVVDVTIERNGELITKKVKLSKFIERHVATVFQWELKNISKEKTKKLKKQHAENNAVYKQIYYQ